MPLRRSALPPAADRRSGGSPSSVRRRRQVPGGTVGGRIACAKTPSASRRSQSAIASSASPITSGTIWVSDPIGSSPSERSPSRSAAAFACRRSTRSGRSASSSSAAGAAATAGGRRGGREDERPGGVDEEVHQLTRAADVGAVAAERLAERADDHVDLVGESGRRDRAAPAGSDAAGGVGLVDQQAAAVAAGEVRELRQRGDVAVHREDAVGDDQRGASRRSPQPPLEVLGVGVPVDEGLRAGQPAAVDDAGVVELVREDDLARAGRARRSCRCWRGSPSRTAARPRFP